MNFVTTWVLAIAILSGPEQGNRIDLVEFDSSSECGAWAYHLNVQNLNAPLEGPKIEFVCVQTDAI